MPQSIMLHGGSPYRSGGRDRRRGESQFSDQSCGLYDKQFLVDKSELSLAKLRQRFGICEVTLIASRPTNRGLNQQTIYPIRSPYP